MRLIHCSCEQDCSDKPDDSRYEYSLRRRVTDLEALLEYLDLEIVLRPRRSKTDGKYKSR